MEPCKIVYLVSTLKKTGPTNVIFNIVKFLPRNYSVTIICLSKAIYESDEARFLELGVSIVRIPWFRFSRLSSFLRNFSKSNNRSVFHSHGFKADLLLSLINGSFRSISTLHNIPNIDYVMEYGLLTGRVMSALTSFACSRISIVVCCSFFISSHFSGKLKNVTTIQNGIDYLPETSSNSTDQLKFKEDIGLLKDDLVFVYIGALISRKNVSFILNSFVLSDKYKNSKLLIVGSGEQSEELKHKFGQFSNIIFLGHVSNPSLCYEISSCYISASFAEGLPNAVLEASAFGLDLFLSDIPSHRECNIESSNFFSVESNGELVSLFNSYTPRVCRKSRLPSRFTADYMSRKYSQLYMSFFEK